MDKIFQFRKATLKDPKNTELMSFDKPTSVAELQPVGDKKNEPSLADERRAEEEEKIKAQRRAEIEEKIKRNRSKSKDVEKVKKSK